jgi:uncharacterized protein HemX
VQGPPVPPPAGPGAPDEVAPEELTLEEKRERRQNRWLVIVTLIAVLAAGAAGYAIAEIENTKDENREGNAAVRSLRADLEAFREQTTERLDGLEDRAGNTASAADLRQLQDDVDALEKQLDQLDQQGGNDLEQQLDDLEQRVQDLEDDSN